MKIKRVGHGFRNFDNYPLRLLLYCGQRAPASALSAARRSVLRRTRSAVGDELLAHYADVRTARERRVA